LIGGITILWIFCLIVSRAEIPLVRQRLHHLS
jgi:hypothetical protein